MEHAMSPTGVAIVLGAALIIDWSSFGPNSIRDRIAFFLALAAIYEGFNGSPLDRWTVGAVGGLIDQLKAMGEGAYIAGAATNIVLGLIPLGVAILTIGALLPSKAEKKFGAFAKMNFGEYGSSRLNTKLWGAAIVLGMFWDLARNAINEILNTGLSTQILLSLSNFITGA